MTTSLKIKLVLALFVLTILGVILGLLTTNRGLLTPLPREADVKVIFTSPPPSPTPEPADLSADEEDLSADEAEPTKKPTAKQAAKPTEEESISPTDSEPSATPTSKQPTETPTPSPI